MHLGKRITIGVIALVMAEVAAVILAVMAMGVMATLALMVLTSLAGALVLRGAGHGGIARFRVAVGHDATAAEPVNGDRLLLALGGILLVLPGFITDVAGALLLVPWARRRLGATIRRAIFASHDRSEGDGVVDLAPDQWRRVRDRDRDLPPG